MEIIIAATKSCNHRPILEQELKDAGLEYKLMFYEEHPEIFEKFNLKTSPLLICDGELVSEGMPEHKKILDLCEKFKMK
ncbi:MAG: thioredoxin family protein [Bacteroidetes bacterium]|nr:thioredoxin family protein [Bacteroidota bacterium]